MDDNVHCDISTVSVDDEQVLVKVPGAIVHLIDKQQSIELAYGDLSIVRLCNNGNVVAVLVCVSDQIQWPLAKDEEAAVIKLDDSHYFFFICIRPSSTCHVEDGTTNGSSSVNDDSLMLNYGLTITSENRQGELLDRILEHYSSFSAMKVHEMLPEVMDVLVDMKIREERYAAYWTTLAPNVEDYRSSVARSIAAGSGLLIRRILRCSNVTAHRINWVNEFLKKRMDPCSKQSKVSPQTFRRIQRIKKATMMSEKAAIGVLSSVVKFEDFITGSIVKSKPGKKFFGLLPGEVMLASSDGYNKVVDAIEVAGKNVLSTSSVAITDLVSHRHGEKAAGGNA